MPADILITGGCGFVGRHLTKRLATEMPNARITIVDALTTGQRLERWPEHLRCDVHEIVYADCIEYLAASERSFNVVFHLAAVVEGRMAIEHNPLKVARDLMIDAAFFEWAVRVKPAKIVYFSSSACYPIEMQTREHNLALAEHHVDIAQARIGLPDMSYGWAKLTGEFLSHLAVSRHDLDVAVYRPFSGYGEDQALTYPFPSIMKRVLENEGQEIVVWGSGEQSRDFVYIEDCIGAVLQTYETLHDAEALNLGTGVPTTFAQLIELSCSVLGKQGASVTPLRDKPEGVFARYCDPTKQQSLGILHATPLERGIEIVADHIARTGGVPTG